MAWVRLDDGFYDHPKMVSVGPQATLLYVRAVCYAARHRTDGFIPSEAAKQLSRDLGGDSITRLLKPKMVNGNGHALWSITDGGYMIHDYLLYNPSRADLERIGKTRAEIGRLGGLAGRSGSTGKSK